MTALTRKDIVAMLGELDDVAIADIIATGATSQELAQAHEWLTNDEALINAGRRLPSGRVGHLVEIMGAKEQERPRTKQQAMAEAACTAYGTGLSRDYLCRINNLALD